MVKGDRAVLDVGANAHLLGGPDQDGDSPGTAGGEELRLVPVGFRLVDEPDGLTGKTPGHELLTQVLIHVPAGTRSAEIAEHELQRPAYRISRAVRRPVLAVAVITPDRGYPLGRDRCLARRLLFKPDQPQVKRRPAAVAAYFQHVVLVRADRAAAHLLGAVAELG